MAVREDDVDRSGKCPFCGSNHFLAVPGLFNFDFADFGVRRPWALMNSYSWFDDFSYSLFDDFLEFVNDPENTENDKEFENYLKWTKRMEQDLENDSWRRESHKNKRAKSKLEKFNRDVEYLEEIQTTAKKLKKRLNVSNSWCSLSSSLQYHLNKLEKLLIKTFQELSMFLIDDPFMDNNVDQDDEQARKSDMSKNSREHMFEKQSSTDKEKAFTRLDSLLKRKILVIDENKTSYQRYDSSFKIGETKFFYEVEKSSESTVCLWPAHAPVSQDLMLSKNKDILSTKLCRYRINLIWISCGIIILIGLIGLTMVTWLQIQLLPASYMPVEQKTTRRSTLDDDFGCLDGEKKACSLARASVIIFIITDADEEMSEYSRHVISFIPNDVLEEMSEETKTLQLREENKYENRFRFVSKSNNDRHHCRLKRRHFEKNNKAEDIFKGLIIHVEALFVAVGGFTTFTEEKKIICFTFKCIVSLCSFIITGVQACAVLCHWKIQTLWKCVTMICSPDCFVCVLMISIQTQKLVAYMNAVICSNKEWNYSSKREERVPGEVDYEDLSNENSADNTEKDGFNSNKAKCNHLAVQAEQSMAFGFGVPDETNAPNCYHCEATRHLYGDCGDTFCVREKQRPSGHEQEEETQLENLVEGKDDSEESELTDSEPFKASGDDIDIHYRGMAKVYIPSKNEDIILEYSAQTRKQTDVKEYDEELKQEEDENNFDDIRQRQRTLDLPKEWMALNRHLQPSVRNLSEDTHFMTEIEKKNNGVVDVSVLIPSTPDIPHRCGASLPIDDVPTAFEANAETVQKKRKLRLQVVPNSPQQHRKQLKIKTPLRKHESKSGVMFHSDETFRNLKYKVKEDKRRQKTPDFTVKESEFDLFALRNVTWLSLNELPVPRIDLTVAFVPQFDPIMVIIDQIANGTPPTPHISMRYELLRFCTLRSYPKDNKPFIIKLAEAGFYYASDGDGVVCYCCGIRRYNWVEEDIPMEIHKRVNPNCKFLKKNEEVNVPVQSYGPYGKALMAIMDIPEPVEREDRSEDVNNDWAPERVSSTPPQQNRRSESAANSLGINTAIPKHTQYATKTARVGSYSGWPDTASHTPEVLADAGFFYAGFGDCVRCFFCGIGLRHWTKEDDPWVEHARWARNCVFVKQKKGEEFVNLVQMSVQYSQDNETQSNTNAGNQLPAQEVERLLLSDASQSVLEMGYQPRIIKKAIEQILRQNGNAKITAQIVMEKVLEIEEAENPLQVAPAEQAAAAAPAPAQTTKPNHEKTAEGGKDSAQSKVEKKPDAARASTEPKDKDKKESKVSDEASQDPKVIKAENEQLKEQTLCKVCLDNTVCIVFLPCGHLVTCADCAPAMRKCPICRALVKGTVRTYMS